MPRDRSRDKFVVLAERRVEKAIKALRLVGNLSNRTNYKYEDNDAEKIVKTLSKELADLKARFEEASVSREIKFKL